MNKILRCATAVAFAAFTASVAVADTGLPKFYGSLLYSGEWANPDYGPVGLYEIPTSRESDFNRLILGANAAYGGVRADNRYYCVNFMSSDQNPVVTVSGYDLTTLQSVYYAETNNLALLAAGMDQDPLTGKIYGIFSTADGEGYELGTVSFTGSVPTRTTVAAMPGNWQAFAIDANGAFYAISVGGAYNSLYKVDRQTGATTLVGSTGVNNGYRTGACFDRRTNKMYWTVALENEGYLAEINTQTGKATPVFVFSKAQQVAGLYAELPEAAGAAPGACTDVSVNFEEDSLNGTVTVTAPSELYGGEPGTGSLDVIVIANGREIGNRMAQWGKSVSIPVTVPSAGLYDLTVRARNSTGNGPATEIKGVYAGLDSPAAPAPRAEHTTGRMNISWLPVTTGAHGGFIRPWLTTYTVTRYPGAVTVAEGLKDSHFTDLISEVGTAVEYTYAVTAFSEGWASEPGTTAPVTVGMVSPAYTYPLSDGLPGWKVINANADKNEWHYSKDEQALRMRYNNSVAMDDWALTPAVRLEAGKGYKVTFKAWCGNKNAPERLEVKYGTGDTPEGLPYTLLDVFEISSESPTLYTGTIIAGKTGDYRIGFHGCSESDRFYMYVNDINIGAPQAQNGPSPVSDFTAVPDADGALQAVLTFKAPTADMNGTPLTSITKIEVKRGASVVKSISRPTPGAELTYTDKPTAKGLIQYSVVVTANNKTSVPEIVNVFVGVDLPAAPSGVVAKPASDPGEILVEWTPVVTTCRGTVLNPDLVTYHVAACNSKGEVLAEQGPVTGNSCTVSIPRSNAQEFAGITVTGITSAGKGEASAKEWIAVGEPLAELREYFAGGEMTAPWHCTGEGAEWKAVDTGGTFPTQDLDGCLAVMKGSYPGDKATMTSGVIDLSGMERPTVDINIFNQSPNYETGNANRIRVWVRNVTDGGDYVLKLDNSIYNHIIPGQWGGFDFNASEWKGKKIQIKIEGEIRQFPELYIDQIRVCSMALHDIRAVSISAPASVKPDTDFDVKVRFNNEGRGSASEYKVHLLEGEKTLSTVEFPYGLEMAGYREVTFNCRMPRIVGDGMELHAVVEYPEDEIPDNNKTENILVGAEHTGLVPPSALQAEIDGDHVTLSWVEPEEWDNSNEPVTDDFEDGEAWSQQYGGWIFTDRDNSPVAGIQMGNVPVSEGDKGAFWIWDNTLPDFGSRPSSMYNAHSGDKYLFSVARLDGGWADDWAVSPELQGTAQTVSFWAQSSNKYYPERVEVYWSTGSTDPADFIKIEGAGSATLPEIWTEFKVQLPEGAKRFAIVSCAKDAALCRIDDVTYLPANPMAGAQLTGYHVYCNGERRNGAVVEETGFTDTGMPHGELRYAVTASYNHGESRPSNFVDLYNESSFAESLESSRLRVAAQGHSIVIEGCNGMSVTVCNASGAVVYTGRPANDIRIGTVPGVYAVRCGNATAKVIVK